MRKNFIALTAAALFAAAAVAGGCDGQGQDEAAGAKPAAQEEPQQQPTNRIDVPAAVRQNLGITFAKVQSRRVASTIRVPGRFEFQPTARREYRSTLPGWVRLLVGQYDEVTKGKPIYQMESPEWHKLRKQLHEAQAAIESATAELAVAQQTKAEAGKTVEVLEQRVEALAGAATRRAELDAELATRRASLPRLDAEIRVKQAALNEARHDFALEVDTAAALLGLSPKFLTAPADDDGSQEGGSGGSGGSDSAEHGDGGDHPGGHNVQRWFAISKVGLLTTAPGVVEALHVTDGSWVDANTLVATVVDPTALRFRATGLQSDLGRLRNGLGVSVVPPQGAGTDAEGALAGTLRIGLAGDPERRTVELLVTPQKPDAWTGGWAKPGVSALLEIAVEDSGKEELAIPASAVVRDELTHIFFRRDPKAPDKVIRMEADLGVSDGKWVAVKSGLREDDEVVLDGVYELKLAGGGKAMGGGHFHADGTWHAEAEK